MLHIIRFLVVACDDATGYQGAIFCLRFLHPQKASQRYAEGD